MLIANPIYDVVFKYLLEDIEIARELLSTILGEEIVDLQVKPQETTTENTSISILRFDFKAIIKTETGELKKVLIELQKAKEAFDVMRFRRYLGDNYRKADDFVDENGQSTTVALPIVTIYFLGFPLDNIKNAVVKVNREYQDVVTKEILEVKENFVELLTHDAFLIQIRLLKGVARTKLEKVLQIFSPDFKTEDARKLNFGGDLNDPLVQKMVARLGRAIADEEIRNKMDVEDEISGILQRKEAALEASVKALTASNQALEDERKKVEAERQKTAKKDEELEVERQKTAKKDEELEAERQKAEALLKELEELRKQIKK